MGAQIRINMLEPEQLCPHGKPPQVRPLRVLAHRQDSLTCAMLEERSSKGQDLVHAMDATLHVVRKVGKSKGCGI
eukprot:6465507-Amphidinium_carterae.1